MPYLVELLLKIFLESVLMGLYTSYDVWEVCTLTWYLPLEFIIILNQYLNCKREKNQFSKLVFIFLMDGNLRKKERLGKKAFAERDTKFEIEQVEQNESKETK